MVLCTLNLVNPKLFRYNFIRIMCIFHTDIFFMYIFKHSMFYYTPCFIFLSIKWQPEEFFNQILQRRSRLTLTREKNHWPGSAYIWKKMNFISFYAGIIFWFATFVWQFFRLFAKEQVLCQFQKAQLRSSVVNAHVTPINSLALYHVDCSIN